MLFGGPQMEAQALAPPQSPIPSTRLTSSTSGSETSKSGGGGSAVTIVKTGREADGVTTGMFIMTGGTAGNVGEASYTPVIVVTTGAGCLRRPRKARRRNRASGRVWG